MEKLKPCSFCGSKKTKTMSGLGEWWIVCVNCEASTNMKVSKEAAIKAWNKRP